MTSTYSPKRFFQAAASLLLTAGLLACLATPASAQYTVTNLVSNQNAIGSNPADPDLVNAWGITSLAASPFWVSDNGTGKSTLYNSVGQKQRLVVTIPPASGTGLGTPTGVIGNTAPAPSSFVVSITQGGVTKSGKAIFLFATQDGTISGWNPAVLPTTAVIAVPRSNFGASYTALTIFTNSLGTSFLYAANNVNGGGIDMFNDDFTFLKTFSDPQIPQKFAPRLGGRPGEPGYRNKVAAKEPTTPQIPAQSASDRSNVIIKVGPCPAAHRAPVSGPVRPPASNRSRCKRCPIEFCCPPVPPSGVHQIR